MTTGPVGSASYSGLTQWTPTIVAAAGKAATSPSVTLSDTGPVSATAVPATAASHDTPPIQDSTDPTAAPTLTQLPDSDPGAWDRAFKAAWSRGQDLENIATSLEAILKQVVLERPTLADANFELRTQDGLIQVLSTDMSQDDRQWLQTQLNANSALLHATQSFHDHTVTNYVETARAVGKTLTSDDVQAASGWADQQFNFLNLLGDEVAGPINYNYRQSGLTVSDDAGNKVELTENPHTANGLIAFMDRLKEMATGFIHYTDTKSGQVIDSIPLNDPFSFVGMMAATYWPTPSDQSGQ